MRVRRRCEGEGSSIVGYLNARAASATAASRGGSEYEPHIFRLCLETRQLWLARLHHMNLRPAHTRAARFGQWE